MVEINNKKLILLNGPKGCGKGVLAHYFLSRTYHRGSIISCKDELYTLTQKFFHLREHEFFNIYNNRELKEKPLPEFKVSWDNACKLWKVSKSMKLKHDGNGGCDLTIRQAMIYVSEIVVKPNLGKDFFGKARAIAIKNSKDQLFIDDSAGFKEELPPVIDLLGQENILLIRVHAFGDSFEGDSRAHLYDVCDSEYDLWNNASLTSKPDMTFKDMDNDWGEYLTSGCKIIGDFVYERR